MNPRSISLKCDCAHGLMLTARPPINEDKPRLFDKELKQKLKEFIKAAEFCKTTK